MLEKLKQYLSDNSSSLKKVFNQLENITIITSSTRGRFTKALTKKQKDILFVFDAQSDIAINVESCLR
jgi:hypothetical protein